MLLLDIAVGVIPLAGWFAAYGALLLATRPRPGRAVPATPELGQEPPAVASYLVNGWKVTVDAVESTLLDLAARRIIEFRQPTDDPRHTTIHILDERPSGLNSYEQRVFKRVARLAVDGVVPLTALTFRDQTIARSWWKGIEEEIIHDARVRGLSRRRFSPSVVTWLTLAGVAVAFPVGFATYRLTDRVEAFNPDAMARMVGFFCLVAFVVLASRPMGDRDTPAGREAAARWLGVREWLRGHEAFADLPPAAVAVWDRYLPYGAALGTTRTASAVIDIGLGDRRRPWSSYGGMWRRVRVRYPRFWPHYGQTAPTLLFRAVLALGAGYLLIRWWRSFLGNLTASLPEALHRATDPVGLVGFGLGVALLAYSGYAIIRTVLDLATPLTLTGQVLWVERWRTAMDDDRGSRRTVLYYLAVDDGKRDRTTAWGLPAPLYGRCYPGDTVTITVRRWSRRVTAVERLDAQGQSGRSEPTTASAPADTTPGLVGVEGLLTADEVSRAVGVPVTATAVPGAAALAVFKGPDGKPVLTLQQISRLLGRVSGFVAGAARSGRAQPVPGVGTEAWVDGDRAVARLADGTMVMLSLMDRPEARAQLPELLTTAVSRIDRARV